MNVSRKIITIVKNNWMKLLLKRVRYSNNTRNINNIYFLRNPWKLNSKREIFRFEETNKIILDNFGKVNSLLEIGCGEGYQSEYLSRVCNSFTGIDVSSRAIKRARIKFPNFNFSVNDFIKKDLGEASFELILACEVLYYMSNVPEIINKMRDHSQYCLVTYFSREIPFLDPLILSIPSCSSTLIELEDIAWRIAWWKNY